MCVQGSRVVYKEAPEQFFKLFKALYSEWGLPFFDVVPEEITEPFFTTTHPTDGFSPVWPIFFSAK